MEEEQQPQQGEEKVKAMYGEPSNVDISIPDMILPPPPAEKEVKKEI